jgi:prepilin-type N-terminal cleavage/methylation domain-containing protein
MPSISATVAVPSRRAFSLTELLVAMTIALVVMAAVAQLFGVFGRGLSGSQATVELSSRMRSSAWQLRKDLSGITCDVVPWLAPEADAGYFEYIEGPRNDQSAAHGTANIEADTDDVLLFTTRSMGEPFAGPTAGGGTVESEYAEVAWFCRAMATQPISGLTMHNLYRRQLLVGAVPGAGAFSGAASITGTNGSPWSFRTVSSVLYPNSLGDLTKREHRFLHDSNAPYRFLGATAAGATLTGDQEGDDVVLTNVIAFDVEAFDPQAGGVNGPGGYIDLATGTSVPSAALAATPRAGSGLAATSTQRAVYDTWSTHYAVMGNPTGINDQNAYATSPPYPVPLRGIEVRIRCYEPSSKQIRQITVRHTFVKK